MSSTMPKPSRFAPYKEALAAISQRTRTPLPSLVFSFAVLHELTAILPVVGLFYGARALGVGEGIVRAVAPPQGETESNPEGAPSALFMRLRDTWAGARFKDWMVEGKVRVERVGRRYGWFGFEKGSRTDGTSLEARTAQAESALVSGRIAGDVANAVVAYALTKALLPLRIALSLYLSPAFSRTFVQPIGSAFTRLFRR
ncbi:hypothetical protein C8Q79DRAFT_1001538 [Trametes meyenii]|nr:hypothetical protein C8Q79DRAFT_1001538 [Trametes meyenii]